MRPIASLLLLLALTPALAGCGLQPLYGGGSQGVVATNLGHVTIPAIPGRGGWLIRNALNERLDTLGGGDPRYRLDITLDDQIDGFGLVQNDQITRERRTLRARYELIEIATGNVVLVETAGSDAGIDVVSSEYATIAAEDTALENLARDVADQITVRLAVFARESGTAGGGQ